MDKEEIKRIIAIARPAVYAVYGRQPLDMVAYNIMSDDCIWIELEGKFDYAKEGFSRYKLRIEIDRVTYLNVGEIS
jgi:hypothetical protein